MVTDPSRAGYDGQRPEAPFLSRALEAVLRLVELYAAERHIEILPEAAGRTDPPRSIAHTGPISPNAVSPPNSPRYVEPPGRIAQSGSGGIPPIPELTEQREPMTKNRRGGWTKGNSTSARIRTGALEFLRQIGRRAKGPEILRALEAKGLVINSKDPAALVSSRIGRSPLFDRTYEGYGLREWSNGAGRANSQD